MTSLARAAPGSPDIDKHHLALVLVEDGLKDDFWGYFIVLLKEDALLARLLLGRRILSYNLFLRQPRQSDEGEECGDD